MTMMEDSGSSSKKVTFGFSRKVETKLKTTTINGAITSESIEITQSKEFIATLEDSKIVTKNGVQEPDGELVIPLIRKNKWLSKLGSTNAFEPNKVMLNAEDAAAAAEILNDVQKLQQTSEDDDLSMQIPLWMLNRLPEGSETDKKLNVEMRAEEPTLENYEAVPVEKYGLAMLRGMGWKPDEGIGKTKQVTKPLEVNIRPRGLGLGAIPVKDKKKEMQKDAEEKAEKKLTVGALVRIIQPGREEGRVGKVTSAAMEADRWTVMLVGEEKRVLSVLEVYLSQITQKDYDKEGKYLNNDRYHDHKKVQDEKLSRIRQQVHEQEDRRAKKKNVSVKVKKEELSDDGDNVVWEEEDKRKEKTKDGLNGREKERDQAGYRRRRSTSRSHSPKRKHRK